MNSAHRTFPATAARVVQAPRVPDPAGLSAEEIRVIVHDLLG